jgi:hypothetical protein
MNSTKPVLRSEEDRLREYFDTPFWRDQFHLCAIYAYATCGAQGSEAVRRKAYKLYEERERV